MVNLNPQTISDIESCLRCLLQPNNDIIKAATDKLNSTLKKSENSLYLYHLLQNSPYDEIKQLSAVILRQKLVAQWTKFDLNSRNYIKETILHLILSQPSQLVRRSISEVIIIIARIETAAGTWPDLFPFLLQLSSHQDSITRQIQIHILDSLIQNVSNILKHCPELSGILKASVLDPELPVRALSVKAIGSAIYAIQSESKVKPFIELIPATLQVIKQCIEMDMEDDVISAYEIFNDLAESPYSSIKLQIPIIVQFSIDIIKHPDIDNSIKTVAIEFLETIIQYQPKILKDKNLLNPILQVLFNILTLENNSVDENDYEFNIYQSAAIAVKECGKSYSSKIIYYPILPLLKEYSDSANPNFRNAVMTIIQQLSYGCVETMKDDLDNIIQFVIRGLKDSDKKVKQNACVCIGKLSQTLTPEIYKYTNIIFPLVFENLADPDDQFILRCCFALENFLLDLEPKEIKPILPNIMDKLGLLIQRESVQVKEFTISVISSIAVAMELEFEPYFNQVLSTCLNLSKTNDPALYLLKAHSIDCIGSLIKTVPKDRFKLHLSELFNYIHDTVENTKSSEVIESSFIFYSNAFEHFGEEIAEILPRIYLQVFKSATSDDGVVSHKGDIKNVSGIDNDGEEKVIDEDEDYESISVRTSFLDEKAAAISCISVMARSLPVSYFPHIETTIQIIEPLTQYFHEEIRDNALLALQSLVVPTNHHFPPQTQWTQGDINHQVSSQMRTLLDFSFQIYNHIFVMERKKEVVARACGCIAQTIADLGPGAIAPYLAEVGQSLLKIFNNALYCQTCSSPDTNDENDIEDDEDEKEVNEDEDDEDAFDEDEDTDYQLINSATECIIEMATVIGKEFKVYLEASLPFLLKLTKKNTLTSIRAVVIGTIAECFKLVEADYSGYLPRLYPLALKGLKDSSSKVTRVSCYLMGVLLQRSVSATQDQYLQALQLISPLITQEDQERVVLDNAIGCICRMISTQQSYVPIATALPVVLSKLPIQEDREEVEPLVNALFVLFNTQFDLVAPHTQIIIQALAPYFNKSNDLTLKQVIIDKINQLINSLIARFPDQMKQILLNTPEFNHYIKQ